ncbi:ATP-binding cassette domain-containing protein [Actinomadura hibisca]|uniref:ATP-binding cassette domain-containing protein n=1 Tax=Actinomadura hibisca TaxID=68565 RepID=UPI00083316D1|nr:ATP-binding cassette domain-containing protein [Actinomadura hibisca]
MSDEPAIEAVGLRKTYGPATVLDGIDLRVPKGSVFALLGPNGAGKTTTVRILATLTRPDGGSARVAGHDVVTQARQVRRAISLTGQYAAVDELQTGTENLRMMARLRRLPRARARERAAELLERFELTEAGGRRVAGYSGGMRRRLDLACGLVTDPEVIFLDEPTTGLDPRSRRAMWDLVAELAAGGVTVLLTTQYLEEADRLADRIALLDNGRIVAEGTATELKEQVNASRLDLTMTDAPTFDAAAHALRDRVIYLDSTRRVLGVSTDGSAAHIRALLDEIDPTRTTVERFAVRDTTLDDVFLALTGQIKETTGV